MATFTDNKDRKWEVVLVGSDLERIRNDCDPKFLLGEDGDELGVAGTFKRLRRDPVLRCRVLFLACEKQIRDRELAERDFYLEVLMHSIEEATEALRKAAFAFIPPQMREALEASAAKMEEIQRRSIEKAMEALRDPSLMERFEGELDAIVASNMTPSPSSKSTPAPSASTTDP